MKYTHSFTAFNKFASLVIYNKTVRHHASPDTKLVFILVYSLYTAVTLYYTHNTVTRPREQTVLDNCDFKKSPLQNYKSHNSLKNVFFMGSCEQADICAVPLSVLPPQIVCTRRN